MSRVVEPAGDRDEVGELVDQGDFGVEDGGLGLGAWWPLLLRNVGDPGAGDGGLVEGVVEFGEGGVDSVVDGVKVADLPLVEFGDDGVDGTAGDGDHGLGLSGHRRSPCADPRHGAGVVDDPVQPGWRSPQAKWGLAGAAVGRRSAAQHTVTQQTANPRPLEPRLWRRRSHRRRRRSPAGRGQREFPWPGGCGDLLSSD
jgi:hypothetical protein